MRTASAWLAFANNRVVRRAVAALHRPRLTILLLIDWLGSRLGHPIPRQYLYAKDAIVTFTPIRGCLRVGTEQSDGPGNSPKWN